MKYQILIAALIASANSAEATALNDFNLIAFGDLTGTSEVEGRTLVFGDINDNGSGSATNFATMPNAIDPTGVAGLWGNEGLIVGGQIHSTVQVNHGGSRVRGADTGAAVNNADYSVFNEPGVSVVLNEVQNQVNGFTSYLGGLSANGVVDTSDFNQAVFNASGDVAVFDIDQSFFDRNGTFDIDGNLDADLYVIRVGGSGALDASSGLNVFANEFGQDDFQRRVAWYFPDYTSLNLPGGLGGAVIAPNADISFGSPLEGSVVANNVQLDAEIHLPTLTFGEQSVVIPEPSSALLGLLAGAGFLMRRRR